MQKREVVGLVTAIGNEDQWYVRRLVIENSFNVGRCQYGFGLSMTRLCNKGSSFTLNNCFDAGGFIGPAYRNPSTYNTNPLDFNISNTYYNMSVKESTEDIIQDIETLNESQMKNNTSFIETLNTNVDSNSGNGWRHWKMGENGYPTFEY